MKLSRKTAMFSGCGGLAILCVVGFAMLLTSLQPPPTSILATLPVEPDFAVNWTNKGDFLFGSRPNRTSLPTFYRMDGSTKSSAKLAPLSNAWTKVEKVAALEWGYANFSPDGSKIAVWGKLISGGANAAARVWVFDVETGVSKNFPTLTLARLRWTPDGSQVAGMTEVGTQATPRSLCWYDASSGLLARKLDFSAENAPAALVRFDSKGEPLVVGQKSTTADYRQLILDPKTGKPVSSGYFHPMVAGDPYVGDISNAYLQFYPLETSADGKSQIFSRAFYNDFPAWLPIPLPRGGVNVMAYELNSKSKMVSLSAPRARTALIFVRFTPDEKAVTYVIENKLYRTELPKK